MKAEVRKHSGEPHPMEAEVRKHSGEPHPIEAEVRKHSGAPPKKIAIPPSPAGGRGGRGVRVVTAQPTTAKRLTPIPNTKTSPVSRSVYKRDRSPILRKTPPRIQSKRKCASTPVSRIQSKRKCASTPVPPNRNHPMPHQIPNFSFAILNNSHLPTSRPQTRAHHAKQ
jgi:hypothetical protein